MFKKRLLDPDFCAQRKVRFAETDQSGFVYFANYLRYMEETEYEFLRSLGLNVVLDDEKGKIGFPRISADLEIIEPATYRDELTIWMKVVFNDGVQMAYQFEVASRSGRLLAAGKFEVACCRFVDGELPRAILIPDMIIARIPETR